jgi:hypothetical protein
MGNPTEPDLPAVLRDRVDHRYRNFAGRGWWPLLERMHEQLLMIDPGYKWAQVNEKLGMLRVYPDDEHYAGRPHVLDQIKAFVATGPIVRVLRLHRVPMMKDDAGAGRLDGKERHGRPCIHRRDGVEVDGS